jgi:hypothetical protein
MNYHKKSIGYNIIYKLQTPNNENKKNNKLIEEYLNGINKNITKNCLFYKDLSFGLDKMFSSKTEFNSSSACIIKNLNSENEYIINTRIVNYKLNPIGKSNCKGKCITINKRSILDKYFNETESKYYFPDNFDGKYVGIEDIRLFNHKNEIYFIGSYYTPTSDKVQIVSNKYDYLNTYENAIIINPNFKTNFNWEKNWVFFDNNDDINVIYKWYPIYICKINYIDKKLNLIKSIENLPNIFEKFRGSTNGVIYNEQLWFIVHQQNNVSDDIKSYVHCFVVFDKNMNLLGYSNEFNFENKLIEYCLGMELTYNNNFAITYSTLDSKSKLVIFSPDYINSLINYI